MILSRLAAAPGAAFLRLASSRGIAIALNNLGVAAKDQGDYPRARTYLEESLAIKRQGGERRGIAVTLNNLGLTAKAQGDVTAAARYFDESYDLFHDLEDGWGQALIVNNIATLAFTTGDYDRALALHKTSLAGRRAMKEKWGVAECLEGLARVAEATGAAAEAARLLGAAGRMRQVYGFPLPPDERPLHERQTAALRAALGDDAFQSAWATGQEWSAEEAVEAGLSLLRKPTGDDGVPIQALRVALLESAHRGLMRCYAHIGRRDLALRQFHLCQDLLASELDVTPAAETIALHDAVRENRAVPVLN